MRRMSGSANRTWSSRGLPARWQSSKLPSWSWSRRWMSRGNVSVSTWRPRLGFLIKLRKRQKKDGLDYFDLCTHTKKRKNTQFTFGQSAFMGSLLCEGFVCLQPFGSQVLHYEVQVETALQGNWAKLNRTLNNHFLMAFFLWIKVKIAQECDRRTISFSRKRLLPFLLFPLWL